MISKITIEWENGDRRTFEDTPGAVSADKLRAARAVIGEDLPKSDKAANAAKSGKPAAE